MTEGFITQSRYTVEDNQAYVYLYGRLRSGESFCTKNAFDPYFYITQESYDSLGFLEPYEAEATDMKNFDEEPLQRIKLNIPKNVASTRDTILDQGRPVYEADIPFTKRFLMDSGINGSLAIEGEYTENERFDRYYEEPRVSGSEWVPETTDLTVLSVDIETGEDHETLYCISTWTNGAAKTYMVGGETCDAYTAYSDVETLLSAFKEDVLDADPDIVTGWNVIDFDLKVLEDLFNEHGIDFDFGRHPNSTSLNIQDNFVRDSSATMSGRMVLDGIHLLKNNFISLDNYKLGTAAKAYAEQDKIFSGESKAQDIQRSYEEDKELLAEYNALDAELVATILENSNALSVTILRSRLTGMELDRVSSTIASFDALYIPRLNKSGYAAPVTQYRQRDGTTGGFVMETKPGIYDNVAVCDFKSLYPSIMRTFNIDPYTFHKGMHGANNPIESPNGAKFSREQGILPEILTELNDIKDRATRENKPVTRQAVKILMNSMYGVLASPNCRFYSNQMANAITGFGHLLIQETITETEKDGYDVIYGDTDSVFIHLGERAETPEATGEEIAADVTAYFQTFCKDKYSVESHILLEFEKLYTKFFTPHHRGSSGGAKKRYAGIRSDKEGELEFVGLEYVRRDWTKAAKKFQKTLLEKAFRDEDVAPYVQRYVEEVRNGEHDEDLVYTKGITKSLDKYVKTTPQHVKAARKLDDFDDRVVSYYMTVDGPEPVQDVQHSIDYQHYIDKQLEPVAESILQVLGTSFYDAMKGTQQTDLSAF